MKNFKRTKIIIQKPVRIRKNIRTFYRNKTSSENIRKLIWLGANKNYEFKNVSYTTL